LNGLLLLLLLLWPAGAVNRCDSANSVSARHTMASRVFSPKI